MSRIAISFGLSIALAACGQPISAASTQSRAIRGGHAEAGHPAVGYLAIDGPEGPSYRCVATLIAPSLAVTAAHCITGTDYAVGFGALEDGETISAHAVVHPGYRDPIPNAPYSSTPGARPYDHDLAVLHLAKAADVEPIPFLGTASLGEELRLVGYGRSDAAPFGERRSLALQLTWTQAFSLFLVTTEDGGACEGDSGGALLSEDGTQLIGVLSHGDPGCGGADSFTRLFAYRRFLERELGAPPSLAPPLTGADYEGLVAPGAQKAAAILSFVNDASRPDLEHALQLLPSAARITSARDGLDRTSGTQDDEAFSSLDELDAAGADEAAFELLRDYVP